MVKIRAELFHHKRHELRPVLLRNRFARQKAQGGGCMLERFTDGPLALPSLVALENNGHYLPCGGRNSIDIVGGARQDGTYLLVREIPV